MRVPFYSTSDVAVSFTSHPRPNLANSQLVGNDLRKAVADGFPITGVIGSDLHKGELIITTKLPIPDPKLGADFWDMGNELYIAPFPVPFIEGNVFDAAHIEPTPPLYAPPSTPPPALGAHCS